MRDRLKWGDFVICGAILLLAVLLPFVLGKKPEGDLLYAEITQNGKVYARVLLTDETARTITLSGNTIVLQGKTAYIKEADCPDGLCVKTGVLSKTGDMAVCLPNRVMVEIVGGQAEIDAVAR